MERRPGAREGREARGASSRPACGRRYRCSWLHDLHCTFFTAPPQTATITWTLSRLQRVQKASISWPAVCGIGPEGYHGSARAQSGFAPAGERADAPRMAHDGRGESLPRLVEIMQRLLAPDGCPWDRAQSLGSLKAYLIEESYEVCDAIDRRDQAALCEELGDVLLQIVFQAEIGRANGWFGPDDVVASICNKLVRRHPHVFGDATASTPEEVHGNWEKLKAAERAGAAGKPRGALEGVPASLPALLAAARVTEK